MGAFDAANPDARRPGSPSTKVADAEAFYVRKALKAQGVVVLPRPSQGPGEDWKKHVFNSIERCDLFIVFGTDSYGQETASEYSTNVEWGNAKRDGTPIFHINMLGDGETITDLIVRQEIDAKSLIYEKWAWTHDPTPMPEGIIPGITKQLNAAKPRLTPSGLLEVTVPAGLQEGSQFPIRMPTGKIMYVQVPRGVCGGGKIQIAAAGPSP